MKLTFFKKTTHAIATLSLVLLAATPVSFAENVKSNPDDVDLYYTVESIPQSYEYGASTNGLQATADKENLQYVENYTIEFYSDLDSPEIKKNFAKSKVKKVTFSRDQSITINPKESNPNSILETNLTFPMFNSEKDYEKMLAAKKAGHTFQLRSISTNVFFIKSDKLSGGEITPMDSSDYNTFTYLTATVHNYDEYNYDRTRKRNSFSASHSRHQTINSSPAFATTTSYDSKPDVLALAWNVGGAIPLNDPSIDMQVAYNNKLADGNTYYENVTMDEATKHDTLFTGSSIGFNVPDYVYRDGVWPTCWGSSWYIAATSGWYNVGSYNGANGTVRTDFLHTYTSKYISITPTIGAPPAGVSLSISGEVDYNLDKSWVYTPVSPY